MAWPVGRPAEEVGVLAMATSERAAPKDRPPLFLEAGSNRWAFAFLSDLSVWRRPSWQALVQRFEREERPDLIVLRASGSPDAFQTNKAKQAGGTATEWDAKAAISRKPRSG